MSHTENELFITEKNTLIKYTGSCYDTISVPEGITVIGDYVFANHTELISVQLPFSLIRIGVGAFQGCSNLKSVRMIYLNHADSSLLEIGELAFEDCTSLGKISIPNSVKTIHDYAFRNCTVLHQCNLPCSLLSIGAGCFDHCPELKYIQIPVSLFQKTGNETYGNTKRNVFPNHNRLQY